MNMRLQKFIAHAGIASRRAAEQMIREGRVTVNGKVVRQMGVTVDPAGDAVKCDGRLVALPKKRHYVLLYKPKRVVSTLFDPQERPTVGDLLPPRQGRLYPVGRLDWDAEGALLLTDDGALAERLAHPRYGVERTYHVKVRGKVEADSLRRIQGGLLLDDGPARPEKVRILRRSGISTWVSLTLREGRHHEIKRIFLVVGHPVQKLRRVSFAGLELGDLRPGESRPLTSGEAARLRARRGP